MLGVIQILLTMAMGVCFILPCVCIVTGKALYWLLLWIAIPMLGYLYIKVDNLSEDL
jgi:hypothetical protein